MRLIDADALMGMIFNDVVLIDGDVKGAGLILADAVEEAPTVDAEVVVRCKDCKHSRPLNNNEKERFIEGVLMCTHPEVSEYGITDVWDAHFCSYGERKDG